MNFIQKFILKQKNPEDYKNWKFLKRFANDKNYLKSIPDLDHYIFKHSGNAGDLIYSLPAMYAIAKKKKIDIKLSIEGKGSYGTKPHPLGDKMLTPKMVEMLEPLLIQQPEINSCSILTDDNYDIDMDVFRKIPIFLNRGNIARWHFWTWGINYDLNKAWLKVTADDNYKNAIVIARSQRYNQPGIDYSFISKYNEIYFVGVEAELKEMKKMIPGIQYLPVNNFEQLAQIIAGCKLFIGNQSFPFSLAEALKVNRLLEVYHQCPNVCVYGENGFDFYFQNNFEKLVKERYELL